MKSYYRNLCNQRVFEHEFKSHGLSIVLLLLFASINLSPSLFLGCFIFANSITLAFLRRLCCILGGLHRTQRINLLGQ